MGLGTLCFFLAESGDPRTPHCRYVNNNEQITCWSHARALRTAEMELPLVKLSVEPLRIQRVIADVARDLGYESNGLVKVVVVLTAKG